MYTYTCTHTMHAERDVKPQCCFTTAKRKPNQTESNQTVHKRCIVCACVSRASTIFFIWETNKFVHSLFACFFGMSPFVSVCYSSNINFTWILDSCYFLLCTSLANSKLYIANFSTPSSPPPPPPPPCYIYLYTIYMRACTLRFCKTYGSFKFNNA